MADIHGTAREPPVDGDEARVTYADAVRRQPPEMRVAGAEARATALESAAATFRESGSDARAKEFEEEAAAIRKKEAHAPPPGCRLDMATGFVVRAERRALRADDAVKIAEKALAEAVETRDAAHKERCLWRRIAGTWSRQPCCGSSCSCRQAPPCIGLEGWQ